jgi:CHAT domain-containing protein/Tfp pilus assembly protein PilF
MLALLALTPSGTRAALEIPQEKDGTSEAVRQALTAGAYSDAERLATDWCATVEAENGRDSLAVAQASDLLVEAQLENGKGGTSATLRLAERVVQLKEQHLGPGHPDTTVSLTNLGTAHEQRGEFTAAVRQHERALAIRVAALGPNDPRVADSLDHLALALIHLERFQEAKRRLDESQGIRERSSIDASLELARTLELVGMLHRYSGSYASAVAPTERALAIWDRLAPDHPDKVFALQMRGDVFLLMGDTASAQRIWASALSLGERTLGPDHPSIAEVLRRLGLAAFSLGNLTEARRLRERALRIGEHSLAPCDPTGTRLAIAVGNSYSSDGEFSEARKLYRRALATARDCAQTGLAGLTADNEATLVVNDAEVSRDLGDLSEADRLYQRAVLIWSKGLGPTHPFVANGLDALAEVAALRGQAARAHMLYERALAIRRQNLGADHPLVAWTLTSLARTEADNGNLPLALRYVDQAIAIFKKSGASDEPDHLARVLELRGILEARRRDFEPARASLSEALSERERIFGNAHPLVAITRAQLAGVDFARGASGTAFVAALEAEQAGLDHLRFTVRYLPERQAMAYSETRPRGLDLALSIAASGAVTEPARLFDTVIQSRGVVLDELASRSGAVNEVDAQVSSVNAPVIAARQRYANLVVRSLQEPVPRAILDEARQQKEEAEQEVAERSVEARAELAKASIGLESIRRALPPESVLVSFVRYGRTEAAVTRAATRAPQPVPSYAAFVVGSRSPETAFVPLGTAASLEGLVRAWRDQAAGQSFVAGVSAARAERSYLAAADRLRQAVWDPLTVYRAGAVRIFIVPDGLLNVVSFAALPDRDGRYLAESESVIHYLATERDLVLSDTKAISPRTLLAVGGPAFDFRAVTPATRTSTLRSGCGQPGRLRFEDLPGSLSEVMELSKLWRAAGADDVTVLTGRSASETAVKRALIGQRVIHFATHGFFLGADCAPGLAGTRAVGGLASTSPKATPSVSENPLLLAGLALAGANRRGPAALDQDEGILTAEEIAGLNLQGTEWAVLSACDTGLGEIRAGEGVFGLRRAFQIAGVRTVIMSLWSVEDRSAQIWMQALYEGRLQKNLNTADAVHGASIAVLRDRRAKGQSTHPFYWAAFVAAGDWR